MQAIAFGPLSDQEMVFGEGLNVIYGPNESGKSSWHAALYAGLCGMRRARGRGTREDVAFANHHRPWDGGGWRVRAVVCLADGRRIEVHNDLDGQVDCFATDIDMGRDCSNEIMKEGSPDGATWLGLDRRSFRSVACVPQGEMLQVLANPELLQEHLQRAAATAGTDATAARALEAIEGFYREHVGLDRANSTKPLRTSRKFFEESNRQLRSAREMHDSFRELVAELEEKEREATELNDQFRALEALVASRQAQELQVRLSVSTELSERHPSPPPDLIEDEQLANAVASALDLWGRRPQEVDLSGPSSKELRVMLNELPPMPDGDLEPPKEVTHSYADLLRARDRLTDIEGSKPDQPATDVQILTDAQELFRLADELAVSVKEERTVATPTAPSLKRGALPLGIAGGIIALAGTVGLAIGPQTLGALMLLGGLGLAGWAVWVARGAGDSSSGKDIRDAVAQELRKQRTEESRDRRDAALRRVQDLELPDNPEQLRDLARKKVTSQEAKRRYEQWSQRIDKQRADLAEAEEALRKTLSSRGHSVTPDLDRTVTDYEESCRRRSQQATESSRKGDLERAFHVRSKAEEAATEARALRQDADAKLNDAATRTGVRGGTPEQTVENLKVWQRRRAEERETAQAARDEWVRLQTILDGSSIEEISSDYEQHLARAAERRSELAESVLQEVVLEDDVDAQLMQVRSEAASARKEADRLRGQVEERSAVLPPLAEVEEAQVAAEAELHRVEQLGKTLRLTKQFLERAQERVHRTIAPLLNATVERWLPKVTEDRYRKVRVDPVTLRVTVEDPTGSRREASLLSHGTAEQIYLLLRVGLAQHLTATNEACPLLLDDVTVQSDNRRKIGILETLKALSEERQIIMFTQEEEVLSWARAELRESHHSILELALT